MGLDFGLRVVAIQLLYDLPAGVRPTCIFEIGPTIQSGFGKGWKLGSNEIGVKCCHGPGLRLPL